MFNRITPDPGRYITLIIAFFSLSLTAQLTTQTFTYTGGIQSFTVPQLCISTISIEAIGAGGGSVSTACTASGGLGASMKGVFNVTPGQVLLILVGGVGQTNGADAGGGGGSFVTTSSSVALIVAGGGGGASNNIGNCGVNLNGMNATITATATAGTAGGGTGGVNGNGGTGTTGSGGAGGGFLSNGTITGYGYSFLNGGAGGTGVNFDGGGYGGGGAGWFTGGNGGGGGGYSGGGTSGTYPYAGGGGGGSYNSGMSQVNTAGVRAGNGSVIISYVPGIPVVTNANSFTICNGGSQTITGSGMVSYTWSTGANTSSIVVSPTISTVYTVQGTNGTGCVSGGTVSVNVISSVPSLTVNATPNVVCQGKTTVITASGANTYTWTNNINNATPYVPASTATFIVTGQNACGTNTAAISVTVNPTPTITASINNPTICSGGSVILNGGGGVGNYTWSPAVTNNSAFIPPGTGNYTVTGAGSNGCTSTAVVGVTVLITPTIAPVVTPTAICFGSSATLSALGATGYTWLPGSNPNTPSVTVSPPVPTTYTVLRSNGLCSSSSTVNLIVYPLPLVNASASPSQICVGTGVNFIVVGPVTQTWSPGGFTAANFTLYPNFANTYTVVGSNGNCTASAVVPIIVNPTPTLSINSSTTTICEGSSVSLTVSGNGPGLLTYTWQPSGNVNNSTEVLSPTSTTIVTVAATNSFGCINTQQQLIVVKPLPNMNVNSNVPYICAGTSAILSLVNPSANVVYNWSNGPISTSVSVSPVVTTSYVVVGTNTLTACQNSNTLTLSVFISTFAVTSPSAICKGSTATLTAVGPAASYLWTNVSGGTAGASVTVSPQNSTSYNVIGTTGSCTSAVNVPLTVNPLPIVTAQVNNSPICRFEVATITGNGASTYSWNTGATTPVLSFTLSVTTTYTLTGTDQNNCSKTVTVTQFVATCPGMADLKGDGSAIRIFPNPNDGNFTVKAGSRVRITIVNSTGQIVHTLSLDENNTMQATVMDLPAGIYMMSAENNGEAIHKKIIVAR